MRLLPPPKDASKSENNDSIKESSVSSVSPSSIDQNTSSNIPVFYWQSYLPDIGKLVIYNIVLNIATRILQRASFIQEYTDKMPEEQKAKAMKQALNAIAAEDKAILQDLKGKYFKKTLQKVKSPSVNQQQDFDAEKVDNPITFFLNA